MAGTLVMKFLNCTQEHTLTYIPVVLIVKKKIDYNLPMKIINVKQLTVCSCNQCTPVT